MAKRKSSDDHPEPVWTYSDVVLSRRCGEDVTESQLPSNWKSLGLEPSPGPWVHWLPEGWIQAKKSRKNVFVSPEGKVITEKGGVEKEVGKSLGDGPVPPKSWPDWLPKDWGLSRQVPLTGIDLRTIYIRPEGDRSFAAKISVESYLRGGKNSVDGGNFIQLVDTALSHLHSEAERQRTWGSAKRPRVAEEPASPLRLPENGQVDSAVEALQQAGTPENGEEKDGFSLHGIFGAWVVLPVDVESVSLEYFSELFSKAGYSITQKTEQRHDYSSNEGNMNLYASGKLFVRTRDRSVALSIGRTYVALLDGTE